MTTQVIAIAIPTSKEAFDCTEFEILAINELNRRALVKMGLTLVDVGKIYVGPDTDYCEFQDSNYSETVALRCELWANDKNLSIADNVTLERNGRMIVTDNNENRLDTQFNYEAVQYSPEFARLTEQYRSNCQWIRAHGQGNYNRMYGR